MMPTIDNTQAVFFTRGVDLRINVFDDGSSLNLVDERLKIRGFCTENQTCVHYTAR